MPPKKAASKTKKETSKTKKEPKPKKESKPKKEPKPKKESKPKRVAVLKPYCGINEIPKRHRLGSMKECADAGQIRYYGLNKIDKLVVNSTLKVSEKAERALRIKLAGLKGTSGRILKDFKVAKNEKEKNKLIEEYKTIKYQTQIVIDKLIKIEEKQKKDAEKANKK